MKTKKVSLKRRALRLYIALKLLKAAFAPKETEE